MIAIQHFIRSEHSQFATCHVSYPNVIVSVFYGLSIRITQSGWIWWRHRNFESRGKLLPFRPNITPCDGHNCGRCALKRPVRGEKYHHWEDLELWVLVMGHELFDSLFRPLICAVLLAMLARSAALAHLLARSPAPELVGLFNFQSHFHDFLNHCGLTPSKRLSRKK